jgi:hypothetical protein
MQFMPIFRGVLAASGLLLFVPAALAQQNLAEATRTIRTALNTVLVQDKDYSLQQIAITDSTAGYKLKASGSFLGSPNLNFSIVLADLKTVQQIELRFPDQSYFRGGRYEGLLKQDVSKILPAGLRLKATLVSVRLGFDSNRLNSMGLSLGLPDSKLTMRMPMTLRSSTADVEVEALTKEKPIVKARMNGRLFLNANESVVVTADVGSEPENWAFSASTEGLTFGAVLRSIGIEQPATFPEGLWKTSLNKGEIAYNPHAGTFGLQAICPFGEIQCRLTAGNPNNSPTYLLGLAPGDDVKFASMDPSLEVLDALGLKNTAIVFSSVKQVADMPVFNRLGVDPTVGAGISLMMLYKLDALSPELSKLLGETTLLMRSTLSNRPADLRFSVLLNSRIPLDEKANTVMTEIGLNLFPDPAGFKVNIGTLLEVKANRDILRFATEIGVDLTNLELQIKGMMQGTWNNPFQIAQGLALIDLGLGVGVSFKTTPIPMPTLEMKGKLRGGPAQAPLISGDMTLALDPADPTSCMVDARFAQLKVGDLVKCFAASVRMPDDIRTTVQTMVLNDCRLSIVPNPAGVTVLGRRYDPGFLIAGRATVSGQNVSMLLGLKQTSLEAAASIKAIHFPPYFSLTGSSGKGDAQWSMQLDQDVKKSAIGISGRATLLGLQADARMNIKDASVDVAVSGKIFNAFNADLAVKGASPSAGADYAVRAAMKQDLYNYIKEYGSAEIDRATKDNQRAFRDASATIQREEAEVRRLDGLIAANRKTVQDERDADCRKFNAAKKDVDDAQAEVNDIQGDINSLKRKINKLREEIDDKPWTAAANGIKIADYGTRIAALETGKKAANLTLSGYKEVLKGLAGICKTTPIDLDPRISGLIAAKETALLGLLAARKTVEGTGAITGGSLKATKWIVTSGNPMGVLDINEAFFEGNLSQMNSGNVTMRVKGTFAGDPINTSFSFSFNNAQATVEAFARSLVQ